MTFDEKREHNIRRVLRRHGMRIHKSRKPGGGYTVTAVCGRFDTLDALQAYSNDFKRKRIV